MATLTIEEAQANLPEIIERLVPGEEILIVRDNALVARLIAEKQDGRQPRRPGSAQGKLVIHTEDDEHLKDFEDYMP
ncbi:MAG: antitoxin of toxin-antitoxin stability system [Planctomycetia bacterium]|nr:antitoxin of toxin-antitoxin stability system [Planctomycetia bacterium]